MFIVQYRESERGWGGEIWYRSFDTKSEALAAVDECNSKNPTTHVPDYYICASYEGEGDALPDGYKF